jgi:hypothetical protein
MSSLGRPGTWWSRSRRARRISLERWQGVGYLHGPALLAWLLMIMPAVIDAQNSREDASVACPLAASQALALALHRQPQPS